VILARVIFVGRVLFCRLPDYGAVPSVFCFVTCRVQRKIGRAYPRQTLRAGCFSRAQHLGSCGNGQWLRARLARRVPRSCPAQMLNRRSLPPVAAGQLPGTLGRRFVWAARKQAIVRLWCPLMNGASPPGMGHAADNAQDVLYDLARRSAWG